MRTVGTEERRSFVNRHNPDGAVFTAGVDLTPKTCADLIAAYDGHPERKFAGPDGQPCRPETRGLLQDLPLVVAGIRHVGKEGNELEAHQAGLITEAERQVEYHDSIYDDLATVLADIGTIELARKTGYDPRTVRRLKRGQFRPSATRLPVVLATAAGHANRKLVKLGHHSQKLGIQAIGHYAGVLTRQTKSVTRRVDGHNN